MKECNLPNEEATTKMPERGTPNNGGVEDKAETPLCLQIKIHWLLSALVIAINLISISVVVRAIYRIGAFGPEGERVLGVIFPIVLLIIFDAMTLPVYKRHRVIFEPRRLTLQLGGLAESLRYSDIISISEKDVYTAAYQWRPTGPDAIRIRTKTFDGAVSLDEKEVFYEELLKRNPSIEIIRKD